MLSLQSNLSPGDAVALLVGHRTYFTGRGLCTVT